MRFRICRESLATCILLLPVSCHGEPPWDDERWDVTVDVEEDAIIISTTVVDIHGDFLHMSIRKEGYENGYTKETSPAIDLKGQDWTRVHHWFEELHPNTFLEGRIDDTGGEGPGDFETYRFRLPRAAHNASIYEDENGSDYVYLANDYYYADRNPTPEFSPGEYEVEVYAWYTGRPNGDHPLADEEKKRVQYIHYERTLAVANFTIPE